MRLEKSKKDGLIRPVDKMYMPLFMHCSNNSIAVTDKYFDDFVKPLLFMHGITSIDILLDDET